MVLPARLPYIVLMEQLDLRVYAIVDPENTGGRDLIELARAIAAGGATLVQLRDKVSDTADMIEEARALKAALAPYGVPKYADVIKRPVISIKDGTVTMTCATPGVKIYYTTDGSTPAFVEANEYTKPFKLQGRSVPIIAIAKKYGFDNSSLAKATRVEVN